MELHFLQSALEPTNLGVAHAGLGLLPLVAMAAGGAGGDDHGAHPPKPEGNEPLGWLTAVFGLLPLAVGLLYFLATGTHLEGLRDGSDTTYASPLLLLAAVLPGVGALLNGTLGLKMPRWWVHAVGVGSVVASFLVSLISFKLLLSLPTTDSSGTSYGPIVYDAYEWISSGGLSLPIRLVLDPLSALMTLIITGVGALIHVYSAGYMSHDAGYARYFAYLNLFCFSMLLLVLGGNFAVTFIGWEGVGMCSYLLIGFWFTDEAKASAGKKAFVVNRVGDFAFLLAMAIVFVVVGSLDYADLQEFAANPATRPQLMGVATLVGILTFLGCAGKSAQIPLYVWLPDAMAGPTPVSALIHAATMVTAGVYLIARLNFLFVLSPAAMWTVTVVGALTALMAATIGVVQNDIKKVLAYSTVSQLGYMFMAVGVGAYSAGISHLMTHAFFKALLFLGAGAVIHGLHDEQDIRKMGGLKAQMPLVRWTFLVGCLAIAGVPGLSGFFSKDEILWGVFGLAHRGAQLPWLHIVVWIVGLVTAGLTAFYMFRLYFLTFEGESRVEEALKPKIEDAPASMALPLVVLALLSVFGGYLAVPHILAPLVSWVPGVGETLAHNALHGWLDQLFGATEPLLKVRFDGDRATGMEWMSMALSTLVAGAGIFAAYWLYGRPNELPAKLIEKAPKLHRLVENKYFVDEAYEFLLVKPTLYKGRILHKVVDEFLIDTLMVQGAGWFVHSLGKVLRRLQTGDVQRYAAYVLLAVGVLVYLTLFR